MSVQPSQLMSPRDVRELTLYSLRVQMQSLLTEPKRPSAPVWKLELVLLYQLLSNWQPSHERERVQRRALMQLVQAEAVAVVEQPLLV
jgi:hypothetical protein